MDKELIVKLLAAYGIYKLYTSVTEGKSMEKEFENAVDFINKSENGPSLDLKKLTAIALSLFGAQQLVKK